MTPRNTKSNSDQSSQNPADITIVVVFVVIIIIIIVIIVIIMYTNESDRAGVQLTAEMWGVAVVTVTCQS